MIKKLTPISAIIVFLVASNAQVLALSSDQKQVIDSGVGYFNIDASSNSSSCVSDTLTGSGNAQMIYNYLVGTMNFKPYQAAGIMGNMNAEAHFEPRLVEYGFPNSRGQISVAGQPSSLDDNVPPDANSLGQPGYGIIQWTSPNRKQGLRDLSQLRGVKASDLGLQLDYLAQELKTNYKSVFDGLMQSTNIKEATDVWLFNYEAPQNASSQEGTRLGMAQAVLTKYGSSTQDTTTSGTISCGGGAGGGQVVDNFSLPVDKSWYTKDPTWFSKPHHDYPAADIPVPSGTSVYSMTDGKVVYAPVGNACGQGVQIDAGNGVMFLYCHGEDGGSIVKPGDQVKAGQLIMHSDDTGESTGPHVHVQIMINGVNHCPQTLFSGIVTGNIPNLNSLPTSGCFY